MDSMFSGCSAVSSLNISHFDYSNVTNMNYMFYGCSNLSGTLTMGGNNKVTDMSEMFYGCSKLTKIDLTNLQLDLVTNMDNMFYGCASLKEIRMGGNPAKITASSNVDYMFNNITTEGILYYNSEYDYSEIIAKLPSTWKAIPLVNATECTSLTIEAYNVTSDKTSTTIRYTAIVNGTNPISGATMTGIELTGKVQSSEFG
jgi:surface protein